MPKSRAHNNSNINHYKLLIGSQNINGGLNAKCKYVDFVNVVKKFDLFCIQETWLQEQQCFNIPGYHFYRSDRKKHKRARRGSGGVVILFKNKLQHGLEKITSQSSDILWARLDHTYFGLDRDIYLACCYIPPHNSPVHTDQNVFEILNEEIAHLSNMGDIMLVGDFNSRIGNQTEYVSEHIETDNFLDIDSISRDPLVLPPRYSEDGQRNEFNKKFMNLINDSDLRILNGRVLGDLQGKFTCHEHNGSSVVDYCIISPSLWSEVLYFNVMDGEWYSDHSSLNVCLKVKRSDFSNKAEDNTEDCSHDAKFQWKSDSGEQFVNALLRLAENGSFNRFCTEECVSIEKAVEVFTSLLHQAANSSLNSTNFHRNKNKHDGPRRENYNSECQVLKREFRKARRLFSNNPANQNSRNHFLIARKQFKRAVYRHKMECDEHKLIKLAELEKKDPKHFWKEIRKLTGKSKSQASLINIDSWEKYFTNLLSEQQNNTNEQFNDYVTESLPTLERISSSLGPMDHSITEIEVRKIIKQLHSGKAVGPDLICNEMLKHGIDILLKPMVHLFNLIISTGEYPESWKSGYISPVHKKGSKVDPNNYRGITVSSCLSKVFTHILSDRLDNYMKENGKWSKNQCGFKKEHRTEDNIFVLQTVFNTQVIQGKGKLYLAFVDFKKYFDTINRKYLLYKLLQNGITGKFYNLIKTMYSGDRCQVKSDNKLSAYIETSSGVKQGCNLSPLLSNLFQNDLHEIFNKSCDPVTLDGYSFNSLSWADDLVLMSTSPSGLQQCLDRLDTYCIKWSLTVNKSKTQCMTCSKGHLTHKPFFYLQGDILENTNKYTYLGVPFHCNGKNKDAISDRILKATRCSHIIRGAIKTTGNVSVKMSMSLFDKQISPILTYGAPIWGIPNSTNYVYVENIAESANIKTITSNVPIIWAKRVGKRKNNSNRKVLMKFDIYDNKMAFLYGRRSFGNFRLSDYDTDYDEYKYEAVHTSYCKFALNVSKWSSNYACRAELGRFPLVCRVFTLCIKYWLRAEQGTPNFIFNKAFQMNKKENHPYIQGIQQILSINGFSNIFKEPMYIRGNKFGKIFQKTMEDQYVQFWNNKARHSEVLKILYDLKVNTYEQSNYLYKITNIADRNLLTKLRIDQHDLQDCIGRKKNISRICPLCEQSNETLSHFLIVCPILESVRLSHFQKLKNSLEWWNNLDASKQVALLLSGEQDINRNSIHIKLLTSMYKKRKYQLSIHVSQ